VPTIEREPVVNASLGGEYVVAGKVPIRAGFFTNFSSAPEVAAADEIQLPHVDMYGITASVGYLSKSDFEVSGGVLYTFGSGSYAVWDPEAGGTGQYQPADARRSAVYFYLSGAKKAAKSAAKELARKFREDEATDAEAEVKEETQ
jgi:hypothetical protein